eukprot:1787594-Rhodomonas_salina.1
MLFPVYKPAPELMHGGIIGHQHIVTDIHHAHFVQHQAYSPSVRIRFLEGAEPMFFVVMQTR